MDDTYKDSVFGKSLKYPAKVKQFEINSKPGEDNWAPQKARRFKNPVMYDVVDTWLDWQLADELLSTSNAVRPAVITVVEKEGREPRTCCDYRLRNARTEVPTFPMPDIGEHVDDSIGYKYYCSFDMAKMFNQIELKKEHRDLAAFITHRGVHAPHRVQFGLAGGPQHAVREVGGMMALDPLTNGESYTLWALQKNKDGENPPYEICKNTSVVKGSRLVPFIDDVFVKSNHAEGVVKQTENLFMFCEKNHLLLSRKKANICKTYLKMLGMVVSREGKHLDPSRIINLLDAAEPKSKETLQSLLCSYNFIRQFIPNFSSIAAPLYDATKGIIWKGKGSGKSLGIHKKDPDFTFTPEMTRAYAQLRAALLSSPILVTPDWSLPLFLSVDASIRGEGWVLWQLIPTEAAGPKVAVAILYGSRKYNETEAAWETTRQESNAIKDAITDVEQYIFGQKFYLFSDHLNLRWMHNSINRAVIRMRNFLSQFQMSVVHCPGIWNNADSHSRLEAHPKMIAMANDLNAVSEAKICEGESALTISIGTDTSQDVDCEGVCKTPNIKQRTETSASSDGKTTAKALCTSGISGGNCKLSNCAWCNPMPELLDDSDTSESESDSEKPFTNTHCFHTRGHTTLQPARVLEDNGWEPVMEHIMRATESSVTPEMAVREALEWNNTLEERLPSLSPCLTDTLPALDQLDVEDLEGCESFKRSAYAYRSITRPRKKKETGVRRCEQNEKSKKTRPTMPADEYISEGVTAPQVEAATAVSGQQNTDHPVNKRLSELTVDSIHQTKKTFLSHEGRRISEEFPCSPTPQPPLPSLGQPPMVEQAMPQLVAGPAPMTRSRPTEVEEQSQYTQTSPADFRAAQVRIPSTEDFASVHGDVQGHHGLDYTYRKLFSKCGSKWANERGQATKVKEALKQWLQGCPACQKVKELREKVKCKHSFIISRPFLEVSYDIIVFTSEDKHGNRYLVVAIDNFTKLVELKATRFKDAESVAQFLLGLQSRYGKIARLRSDRDPAFTGLIVKHINDIRAVETVFCVAYHPQANSICERQNALIMQQLSAMCVSCALGKETKASWSDLVPFVFSIINNTPKSPLGISPLAMIYGIFANFERPLLPQPHAEGDESNPVDFVEELMRYQTQLLEAAENIQEAHLARYAQKYEQQRMEKKWETPRAFQQGDFVLLKKTAAGKTSKLTPKYVGPRLVLERMDNDPTHPVLDLMDLTDMTVTQAAAEDCKLFNTDWFDEPTMTQELTKLAASDKEEFLVEAICGHLPKGSKRSKPLNTYMFRVKWKDFPESENTWEPWSSLKNLEPYAQYAIENPLLNLTPTK
jgi:hypothetical protein